MSNIIYLDEAATTPVAPEVWQAMQHSLSQEQQEWGNPNSGHYLGLRAADIVQQSLQEIAKYFDCNANELVITSGATESINQALKGVMYVQTQKRHCVMSSIEHKASLQVAQHLSKQGYHVSFVSPNEQGIVTLAALKEHLRPETALVSLIWVNNETGAVNPVEEIADYLRHQRILLHVDATQAVSRFSIQASQFDLLSMSAHKCYGPKGIGLLYRRAFPKIPMQPLLEGGSSGIRPGTLATHQIVGLTVALRSLQSQYVVQQQRARSYAKKMLSAFSSLNVKRHVDGVDSLLNLHFPAVDNETLMLILPHICFSTGSACNTQNNLPSHVLLAMGVTANVARQSVRLSFGRFLSEADLDNAIHDIKVAATHLQCLALGQSSQLMPQDFKVYSADIISASSLPWLERVFNPQLVMTQMIKIEHSVTHHDEKCSIQVDAAIDAQGRLQLNAAVMGCPYTIGCVAEWLKAWRNLPYESLHNQDQAISNLSVCLKECCLPSYKIAIEVLVLRLAQTLLQQFNAMDHPI